MDKKLYLLYQATFDILDKSYILLRISDGENFIPDNLSLMMNSPNPSSSMKSLQLHSSTKFEISMISVSSGMSRSFVYNLYGSFNPLFFALSELMIRIA